MIALGFIVKATMGTDTVVDGLACMPTNPASMTIQIGPGSITQFDVVDRTPYGSMAADISDPLLKIGINLSGQTFDLQAPAGLGASTNYLIQACFQETDQDLTVLPYYNAANPAQPYSGPTNSGVAQATLRSQTVQLQLKSGIPSSTGTQITPVQDQGWVALYVVTTTYGQTSIVSENINVATTAPFFNWKLPRLRPGFGSGIRAFQSSDTFIVPQGVYQLEVELWGGGAGSFASVPTNPSGGGSGGGYARKLIQGVLPGQSIAVTVGNGGIAGRSSGTAAGPGGTSSFGQYVTATGGGLNILASLATPQYGATPPGVGVNGDINLSGSAGLSAVLNQGGMGGGGPMGGNQNSGTTGVAGTSPGGGASGAGTGADSQTPYDGAMGGDGLVIVRW